MHCQVGFSGVYWPTGKKIICDWRCCFYWCCFAMFGAFSVTGCVILLSGVGCIGWEVLFT